MKKQGHMTPRSIRRAAERKARKEARKALKLAQQTPAQPATEAKTLAATANAMANWKDLLDDDLDTLALLNGTREPRVPDPLDDTPGNSEPSGDKKKTSQARLNANRANAKHSTGPRTDAGRITSSQNRRIHGLTPGSNFLILETEDAGAFQKLRENLLDEHKPETQSETTAIEDMAQHLWLRQRGRNFQNEALDEKTGKVVDEKKFFLYERYIESHDKAYQRCFLTLSRIRKERELLRIGFDRKRQQDMKFEIKQKVQQVVERCDATGDWSDFQAEMFAFRAELMEKYRAVD